MSNQNFEVPTYQWFTAGKSQLCSPHGSRLLQDLKPLISAKLVFMEMEIHRIGAVGTLQRTGIRKFQEQP
jgi:hypothetical protein